MVKLVSMAAQMRFLPMVSPESVYEIIYPVVEDGGEGVHDGFHLILNDGSDLKVAFGCWGIDESWTNEFLRQEIVLFYNLDLLVMFVLCVILFMLLLFMLVLVFYYWTDFIMLFMVMFR